MQFGKRAAEAPKLGQGEGGTGGTRWMRTLKPGEYRMRFLDETDDWIQYWEHYNPTPGGFPFPCTGDKSTCPGCTSGIEKMEKASPKYAVNAKVGDYVDIYKFPTKLFNKMEIRSERNGGTITDRDFLITRIGNDTSTDYDIDMLTKSPLEKAYFDKRHDIQQSLEAAFKEAWPDWVQPEAGERVQDAPRKQDRVEKPKEQSSGLDEFSKPADSAQQDAPAEKEVTEAELRAMSARELMKLCVDEDIRLPADLPLETDKIVDWMLENL